MVKLPDISDLIKAENEVNTLKHKLTQKTKELNHIQEKVIQKYKAAGISPKYCNHPIMEKTECKCYGKIYCERSL